MRKIMEFLTSQLIIFLSIACTCLVIIGFVFTMSNSISNQNVFSEEIQIENYQFTIDFNTGAEEVADVLKLEVNNLNNSFSWKTETVYEVSVTIGVFFLLMIDVFIIIWMIFNYFLTKIRIIKCKKILEEKYDLSNGSLYELPTYEPIIANAIYKKKHQYEMTVARFEYYYRIKGIFDKYSKLKEEIDFDINSLTEIEKMIMKKFQKDSDKTKKLNSEELPIENQKNRKEFKNKIDEYLKEKGYYKEDIIKIKTKNFFAAIEKVKGDKEYFLKSDEVFRNFLIFLVFGLVVGSSGIAMLAAIILGIWILIKYFEISLTPEGEIERAKIIYLVDYLKKKKTLSEEEEYFLIMLTKL